LGIGPLEESVIEYKKIGEHEASIEE